MAREVALRGWSVAVLEAAHVGWAASGRQVLALIPALDDYLRPDEARARFARVPQAEVVAVDINPLVLDDHGATALDALVIVEGG